MKKIFLFFFVCFIIGGLSGYWFYISKINHSDLNKNIQNHLNLNIPESLIVNNTCPVMLPFENNFIFSDENKPLVFSLKSLDTHPKPDGKPKLAIIMDDMAYPWQLQSLHKLKLKITPSFFPYNQDNKFTPKMARDESFYMVHLPMEALNFYQSSHKWLKTGESKKEIESYIKKIKEDFPKVAYINNHTGSKFTASYKDMKNFIDILEKYGITFVDSRTTVETKAPEIYAQMHKPLISRQIFLDNKNSINNILKQIKKAVVMAKKNGYAIAICHPHQMTFEALQLAKKKKLFEDVELVNIKEIDNWLKGAYAE